jgi:hypothetical protein
MTAAFNPGGVMKRLRPKKKPKVNPGGVMKKPRPARKKAAKPKPAPKVNPGGPMKRAPKPKTVKPRVVTA